MCDGRVTQNVTLMPMSAMSKRTARGAASWADQRVQAASREPPPIRRRCGNHANRLG